MAGAGGAAATRRVRLVDVPTRLLAESDQHGDDLLRELVLVLAASPDESADDAALQRRLLTSAERYAGYGRAVRGELGRDLRVALDRSEPTVTVEFAAPEGTDRVTEAWGLLCEEMDDYCRRGALLSLPAPPEVAALRRWCVEETLRQLRDGDAPRPWRAPAPQASGS